MPDVNQNVLCTFFICVQYKAAKVIATGYEREYTDNLKIHYREISTAGLPKGIFTDNRKFQFSVQP